MKISKESIVAGTRKSLNGLFVIAGLAGIGYGLWQVYEPAAFVVLGGIILWMGLPER